MRAGLLLVVLAALVLSPAAARAEISGFKVNSVEGVGDMEDAIQDRLKEDLRISYSDCKLYIGDAVARVDGDEETGTVVEHDYPDVVEVVDTANTPADNPWGKADSTAEDARILLTWSVSSLSGYDYAIKIGSCSDTGSLTDEESSGCTYLVSRTKLDSFTNNELYIDMLDILPDGCNEGDTGETGVYFFVQWGDDTMTKQVSVVKFTYDFDPPAAPQNLVLEAGEENIQVSWDDETNSEDVEYVVYWSQKEFDVLMLDSSDVSSKGGLTAKSYQITGLEIGTQYYVAAAAEDDYGNVSPITEVLDATPEAVDDFWEHYKKSGGQEEGGYCFVATAAYGSPMAPSVRVLQRFRDQALLGNAWGRKLTDLYYTVGPDLARMVKANAVARLAARVVLVPAVAFAWLVVDATWPARIAVLLAMAGIFLGVRTLRRRSRARRAS
jgi:hypothetical protein